MIRRAGGFSGAGATRRFYCPCWEHSRHPDLGASRCCAAPLKRFRAGAYGLPALRERLPGARRRAQPAAIAMPASIAIPRWIGTAVLVGCGVLPVTAMIGKIVPFRSGCICAAACHCQARIPAMQAMISPGQQRWQANLLLLAYVLLLALRRSARDGWLCLVACCSAAANFWLGFKLLRAVRCLRRTMTTGGLPPRHSDLARETDR
ncbi:hypothetical protein ACU4GD_10230 [Cupriavidus basilensis]